jgi:hypothetical protein
VTKLHEAPRGTCNVRTPEDPTGLRCDRDPVCAGYCRANPEDTTARFSRPTEQHFLGKCDAELAVSMPEEMKADFAAVAAISKTTPTELARRVLSDFLYGRLAQVQRIVSR